MPDVTRSRLLPSRLQFWVELLLALLLTRLPIISVPFKWLESFFHELSHGLVALLSGGSVSQIRLFTDGSGLCYSQGGWPLLIAFAGYAGAAFWGAVLFALACRTKGIRTGYLLLGAMVILTALFWGRDLLSLLLMLGLALLFLLPLKFSQHRILRGSLRLMALIVMLNALLSPLVLLNVNQRGDAYLLAQMTFIPAIVWIALWLAAGMLALYSGWYQVKRGQP